MNIDSSSNYPSNALSNFAPHKFIFSYNGFTVDCNSMEGLLQSFKFKNPEMQKTVCKLVGKEAKFKGKKKNWYVTQTLWWGGNPIRRESKEYQKLLDEAYNALFTNTNFKNALLASENAVFKHSIGKTELNKTVLTVSEFCSRITKLRNRLKNKIEIF